MTPTVSDPFIPQDKVYWYIQRTFPRRQLSKMIGVQVKEVMKDFRSELNKDTEIN